MKQRMDFDTKILKFPEKKLQKNSNTSSLVELKYFISQELAEVILKVWNRVLIR